jgi:NAD(P)-dependent dehydrogenase (short-subunit alcohol dehydrogenase family)
VVSADVTNRSAVEAGIRDVETAFGPITIAVNNAGVDRPFGPVEVVDPDAWWHAQAIHVLGPYIVMHAVSPGMRARGQGRIINVSSSAADIVGANSSAYCVGKSTLVRLTQHVDAEIKGAGLAAFVIDPGTVMTDMGKSTLADPEAQKWLKPLVQHLSTYGDIDPSQALAHLGRNFVALASGRYDALSARLIRLDLDLEEQLREMEAVA